MIIYPSIQIMDMIGGKMYEGKFIKGVNILDKNLNIIYNKL